MIDRGRHNVLGVRVDAVDYDRAVEMILHAARHRRPLSVSALAVHGVMTGVSDVEHRHRLNRLDLVVPDGQPVRWALNWLHGAGLAERVYGPDLTLRVCKRAAELKLPLFLFGGTAELLAALEEKLQARFPDLRVAGRQASRFRPMTEQEQDELVARVRESGAALVLVGLGCPRQEVSAYELRDRIGLPLMAVGAAFNFHAGQLAQAPPGMQRLGLEWLFRLWTEPRRLWRRYVLLNPVYLALLFLQWTGLYALSPDAGVPPVRELRPG